MEKVSEWVGERKWLSIIDAQEKVQEKVGGGYCTLEKPIWSCTSLQYFSVAT